MTKQSISIGSTPGDGLGTPWRDAFDMINENFTELYTRQGAVAGTLDEEVVSAVKYFEVSEKWPGELFYISEIIAGTLESGVYTYYVEISKTLSLVSYGDVVMKYAHTAGAVKTELELIALDEYSGEGIQGKMLINWGLITLGRHFQGTSWAQGGIFVVNADKSGSSILDSKISVITLTDQVMDGSKQLYCFNPGADITAKAAAYASIVAPIKAKNIAAAGSGFDVVIAGNATETFDGIAGTVKIEPGQSIELIPYDGNFIIASGTFTIIPTP